MKPVLIDKNEESRKPPSLHCFIFVWRFYLKWGIFDESPLKFVPNAEYRNGIDLHFFIFEELLTNLWLSTKIPE